MQIHPTSPLPSLRERRCWHQTPASVETAVRVQWEIPNQLPFFIKVIEMFLRLLQSSRE